MKERRKRDAKRLKRILKPRIASAKRKEEVKETETVDSSNKQRDVFNRLYNSTKRNFTQQQSNQLINQLL